MNETRSEYIDLDTPLELKAAWGNTYKPYTSTLRELLDVNHIPYTAADVRPVARGKWVDEPIKGIRYHCSVCQGRFDYTWRFCPNCGADMREES